MTFNRKADPIISNIRTGTTDNPYVAMEESLVVDHNGKIQLTEYPSEFHKVKVIGENQDWHEIRSGIPDVDEYKVDYLHKTITFDVAHAGRQLLFQYQGMGNSLISSKNIYTNINEGAITETLHDIIETGRDGIDTLGRVEQLETEITQNEDARKLNETERVQAEESRKTNETARQRNEEERIDSEEQRKSDELIRNQNEENRTTAEADRVNAETIRKQNEQSRVDAEELRQQQEDIRKTSEESRVNAENNRELNETEREQSESERIDAEILRDTSESDRQEAELVRDSNEQDRVNAENIRRTNEDARSLAEEERISAESIRENNEQDRINAENNRETNEQTRKDNENTRITEHSSRMQEVDNLITNTKFIEEWSSATTYHTNNIVRYNNSSFISLIDNNIGNTPDSTQDTEFWGILALKGVDGKGSVSSVSGKSPDTDGNVDLTASDVDAIPSSEKGIANGVAKLNAEGKVVDANGNEVEGKVKSVNGQTGDVQVNVPTKTSQLENDSSFATTNDVQSVSNEIGDLSQLQTENKDNLVESVNETVSQLAQRVRQTKTINKRKSRYIGHKGLSSLAPENTLAAYTLCAEYGYWGGECDVWCTSDGEWVLHHDATIDRMTNGTGTVTELTLAEIKSFIIDGGNRVSYYPNQKVPTLEEYLLHCKKINLVPVIEIKTSTYDFVYTDLQYQSLVEIIQKCGMEEDVIVVASEPSLTKIRQFTQIMPCQLFNTPDGLDGWVDSYLKEIDNAMLSTDLAYVTDKSVVDKVHNYGYELSVFVVNDQNLIQDYEEWGVDYITTDLLLPAGGRN